MSALTNVVDDKIWTVDRPVWFSGVRLRARTTVIRLDDGGRGESKATEPPAAPIGLSAARGTTARVLRSALPMQPLTFGQRHGVLVSGLGLSVGIGCLIAFVGQTLAPSLAKLPGLILCGGGEFELVLRRRTSYGACTGGADIHYGVVLVVSSLVWSVACSPLGVLFAHLRARRSPE